MTKYPVDVPVDNDIKDFIHQFYIMSDTPNVSKEYVNCFTNDARAIFGPVTCDGHDAIRRSREATWANQNVLSRRHIVEEVFPFGKDCNEAMLRGVVELVLKVGQPISLVWSARATYVKEGDQVKMRFYQVYLDSAVLQKARTLSGL
ncbi:hypothetical protein OIDMADRAFT_158131 [Oidiodendron maius Zn]|uniref:SnoaL-like domain-containing protein n=1 Tax=Oidiodendron maius (strain Zn) TaxID=913774 RepID=A0A0C3HK17_OIDMZ|nr:hypothetical protein OIDMADRAFT_158131 [Oidiodendron maius Zn]